MNPQINLITFPDKIFSDTETILLIGTSDSLKNDLQINYLHNIDNDINIFIYDEDKQSNDRIDWLLSIFHYCELCIIDLDNCPAHIRPLISYFIGKSKSYWLTNDVEPVYNYISTKRVYNLDFLNNRRLS